MSHLYVVFPRLFHWVNFFCVDNGSMSSLVSQLEQRCDPKTETHIDQILINYHQYILYLGFGTTALVDCSIAGAMCVILYKCSSGVNTGIAR